MYIYIYMYIYVYMYIDIFIDKGIDICICICICVCILLLVSDAIARLCVKLLSVCENDCTLLTQLDKLLRQGTSDKLTNSGKIKLYTRAEVVGEEI